MKTEIELKKEQIIEVGRRLWLRGMVAANDGNISCRVENGFLITASGISKGFLTSDNILLLDRDGQARESDSRPSIETALHLGIYRCCPKVDSIVHAHPPYASAFSLADVDINDCPLEEIRVQLGQVQRIPYAPAGSEELAKAVAKGMCGARVGLMLRHGAVAVGSELMEAFFRMEALEQAAKIAFIAKGLSC